MLAYVAAGRGAAYFECDLAAWDTAAGALLVEEAGGTVTDADGARYNPLTRQIVAAGACHGDLRALVDAVVGARLDDDEDRTGVSLSGGRGVFWLKLLSECSIARVRVRATRARAAISRAISSSVGRSAASRRSSSVALVLQCMIDRCS